MPALTAARTFPEIAARDIIRELPGVYGFLRYRWGDLTPRIDVLEDMFVVHCDGLGIDFDWKPLDYALVAVQRKELSISKRQL